MGSKPNFYLPSSKGEDLYHLVENEDTLPRGNVAESLDYEELKDELHQLKRKVVKLEIGLKSKVVNTPDLCEMIRRLILEDDEVQSKLLSSLSKVSINQLDNNNKTSQSQGHEKSSGIPKHSKQRLSKKGSKKTRFPFNRNDKHPLGI